jgi:hypothetical protein
VPLPVPALDPLSDVAGGDDQYGAEYPERPHRLARDDDADEQRPDRLGSHQHARARGRCAPHRPELHHEGEKRAQEAQKEDVQPPVRVELDGSDGQGGSGHRREHASAHGHLDEHHPERSIGATAREVSARRHMERANDGRRYHEGIARCRCAKAALGYEKRDADHRRDGGDEVGPGKPRARGDTLEQRRHDEREADQQPRVGCGCQVHAPRLQPDHRGLRASQADGDQKASSAWESLPPSEADEPGRGHGDEEAEGDTRGHARLRGEILRSEETGTPDRGDSEEKQVDDGFGTGARGHTATVR